MGCVGPSAGAAPQSFVALEQGSEADSTVEAVALPVGRFPSAVAPARSFAGSLAGAWAVLHRVARTLFLLGLVGVTLGAHSACSARLGSAATEAAAVAEAACNDKKVHKCSCLSRSKKGRKVKGSV